MMNVTCLMLAATLSACLPPIVPDTPETDIVSHLFNMLYAEKAKERS